MPTAEKVTFRNRLYAVHVGKRGGRYIVVNKKKMYLSQNGGGLFSNCFGANCKPQTVATTATPWPPLPPLGNPYRTGHRYNTIAAPSDDADPAEQQKIVDAIRAAKNPSGVAGGKKTSVRH